MPLTILLSPVGTGLRSIQEKLRALPGVVLRDVEDVMITKKGLWDDPRLRFTETRNVRELLGRMTKPEVMRLWADAFATSLDELEADEREHKVLAFHPSLFSPRRNEHFSTLGYALESSRVPSGSQVVLLIDDVFDMWTRLSQSEHDLFRQSDWLRRRTETQELSFLLDPRAAVSSGEVPAESVADAERARDHLVWSSSITILSQLLSWRHLDMIGAESLADAVGCRLTTIGVKHPFTLLKLLVTHTGARSVYLSHPISRPRRAHASSGIWPDVVAESNALAQRLAARSTVLICPTAIDEYRLQRASGAAPWDVHQRDLVLSERWPALASSSDAIETSTPSSSLRQIPEDGELVSQSDRSQYAKTLEDLIFAEVPFRDHFLVQHTSSFLVYRPLYTDGKFSGGVQSEIEHWQNAVSAGAHERQALFVHTEADVRRWLEVQEGQTAEQLRTAARRSLEHSSYAPNVIDAILSGRPLGRDMLDTEPFGQLSQTEVAKRVFTVAAEAVFYIGLTSLPAEFYSGLELRRRAPVIFLEGESASETELDRINAVLQGADSESSHYIQAFPSAVRKFLSAEPHEWALEQVRSAP